MRYLRHYVAGLVVVSIFIGLFLTMYNDLEAQYGIVDGGVKTFGNSSGNIMELLNEVPLVSGVNSINTGIIGLTTQSDLGDILGSLAALGIGVLKTTLGLLLLPYSIADVIFTFYGTFIPPAVAGVLSMILVYGAFILLSTFVGRDV